MPQMFNWIFYAIVLIPTALLVIDGLRTPRRHAPHQG